MGTIIADKTDIGTNPNAPSIQPGITTRLAFANKQKRTPKVTTNIPNIIKIK